MLFCRLLSFFRITFFEKFFQEYHQCQNSLDLDQAQRFVGPDLGPNCLQKLSAEDKELIILLFNPSLHNLFLDHDIIFYF